MPKVLTTKEYKEIEAKAKKKDATNVLMTKKKLKERSSFHCYTGRGIKVNAIFFDWKQGLTPDDRFYCGYKYMVKANVREATKAELLDVLHGWVNGSLSTPPYYVDYRFAETDAQRFKVPLSI